MRHRSRHNTTHKIYNLRISTFIALIVLSHIRTRANEITFDKILDVDVYSPSTSKLESVTFHHNHHEAF